MHRLIIISKIILLVLFSTSTRKRTTLSNGYVNHVVTFDNKKDAYKLEVYLQQIGVAGIVKPCAYFYEVSYIL